MNAAETIAAAIEKLEKLRDAGTPGPYGVEDGWQPPQWKDSGWTYVRVVAGEPNRISGIRGMVLSTDGSLPASEGKARTLADAELIVTLHRTIDAQLALLRAEAQRVANTRRMIDPEYPVRVVGYSRGDEPEYRVDGDWYVKRRPLTGTAKLFPKPESVWLTERELLSIDPTLHLWDGVEPEPNVLALATAILGGAS